MLVAVLKYKGYKIICFMFIFLCCRYAILKLAQGCSKALCMASLCRGEVADCAAQDTNTQYPRFNLAPASKQLPTLSNCQRRSIHNLAPASKAVITSKNLFPMHDRPVNLVRSKSSLMSTVQRVQSRIHLYQANPVLKKYYCTNTSYPY